MKRSVLVIQTAEMALQFRYRSFDYQMDFENHILSSQIGNPILRVSINLKRIPLVFISALVALH